MLLTCRTAVISVCCVSMLAIIMGVLASLFSGVEKGSCAPDAENKSLAPWVLPVISTVHSIIPLLVLVILTPLIIAKLCHVRTKRSTLGNTSNDDATFRNATMLTTVILVYFACVPVTSMAFFIISSSRSNRGPPAPWMFAVIESLMTLEQVNYAVNFCLYGLISHEFKQALKDIFILKNQATIHKWQAWVQIFLVRVQLIFENVFFFFIFLMRVRGTNYCISTESRPAGETPFKVFHWWADNGPTLNANLEALRLTRIMHNFSSLVN